MVLHPRRASKVAQDHDPDARARHLLSLFLALARSFERKNGRVKKKACLSLPHFSLSSAREREREPVLARVTAAVSALCTLKANRYALGSTTGAGEAQRSRRGDSKLSSWKPSISVDRRCQCPGWPRRRASASHGQADAGAPRPGPLRHALLARGDAGGQRVDVRAQEVIMFFGKALKKKRPAISTSSLASLFLSVPSFLVSRSFLSSFSLFSIALLFSLTS